jgi:hypothetical protein
MLLIKYPDVLELRADNHSGFEGAIRLSQASVLQFADHSPYADLPQREPVTGRMIF